MSNQREDPRLGKAEGQDEVALNHTIYIPQKKPESLPTARNLIVYGHLRACGLAHKEAIRFAPVPYECELENLLGREANWRDWLHWMAISEIELQAAYSEITEFSKEDSRITPVHDVRPFGQMSLTTTSCEFHETIDRRTGKKTMVNHDFRSYYSELELRADGSVVEYTGRAKGCEMFGPHEHSAAFLEGHLRDLRNWYCVSRFHRLFRDGPKGVWYEAPGRRIKVATSSVGGVICDKDKPHDIYGDRGPTWSGMCEAMQGTDSLLYTSKSNYKDPANNRYRVILWFDYRLTDAAEWYPVLVWTYRNIYPCADHVIRNCVQAYTAGGERTEVVQNHGGHRLCTTAVLTWLRYFHRRESALSNTRRMSKFDREDDRYLMGVIREWQVGVHEDTAKKARRNKRNADQAKRNAEKIAAELQYNPEALESGFNEWIPPSCGVPRLAIKSMSEKALADWAERSPNHARHNVLFGIALKLFREIPDPFTVAVAMLRCNPIRAYVCGPEYDPRRFANDIANAWDRHIRHFIDPSQAEVDDTSLGYVTGETATHERSVMQELVIPPETLEPIAPLFKELIERYETTFGRPYTPLMRQTLRITYHWHCHGPDHAILSKGAGAGKSTAFLLLSLAFPGTQMLIVKRTTEDVRECIRQHVTMGFPVDRIAGYEAYDSEKCAHAGEQVYTSENWGEIPMQRVEVCRRCERNGSNLAPHERCPMAYAKTNGNEWRHMQRRVVTQKKWQLMMEKSPYPKCPVLCDEAINPVESCRIGCVRFRRFAGLIPGLDDGRLEDYMRRLGIPKEMMQTPAERKAAAKGRPSTVDIGGEEWEVPDNTVVERDLPEPEVCNIIDQSPGLTDEQCKAARKALRDSYRMQLTRSGALSETGSDGEIHAPANDAVRECFLMERKQLSELLNVMRQIPGERFRQVATRDGEFVIQRRSICLQRPTRMLIADATARENPVSIPGYVILHVPGEDADATGLRLVIERGNATKKSLRDPERRARHVATVEALAKLPDVHRVHHITTADPERDRIDVRVVEKAVKKAGKEYTRQSVGRMVGSNDAVAADLVDVDASTFPGPEEIALRYGWDTEKEMPYGWMWSRATDLDEETGEVLGTSTSFRFRHGFDHAVPEAYRIATAVQQRVQGLMRGCSRLHAGRVQYGRVIVSNLQEEEALMAALPGAVKFKIDGVPKEIPEQLRTMPSDAIRLTTSTEMLKLLSLDDVPAYRSEMPAVRMRAYLAAVEREMNAAASSGAASSTAADYAVYERRDIERDLILTLCYDPESLMKLDSEDEESDSADGELVEVACVAERESVSQVASTPEPADDPSLQIASPSICQADN